MTKEEFITYWLQDSAHRVNCPDREYFDKHYVVLPCECEENCKGWQAVFNHPLMIENHNRKYNPDTRKDNFTTPE